MLRNIDHLSQMTREVNNDAVIENQKQSDECYGILILIQTVDNIVKYLQSDSFNTSVTRELCKFLINFQRNVSIE